MKPGVLIGPYARQVLPPDRIKFWFAYRSDDFYLIHRYEVLFSGRGLPAARHRPYNPGGSPRYGANFEDFNIPEDLSAYSETYLPRHPRDKLAEACMELFDSDDIAAITALRITGLATCEDRAYGPPQTPLMERMLR